MEDRFEGDATQLDSPANGAYPLDASFSDTVDLPLVPRAVYVGVSGDIVVQMVSPLNSNTPKVSITFTAAAAGSILPIRPSRILSTGTTATGLVALF